MPPRNLTDEPLDRTRNKPAPLAEDQREAARQARLDWAQRLNGRLEGAWDDWIEVGNAIGQEFGLSFDQVHQKLLIAGNTLKQHRKPAIHNAYSYCWGQVRHGHWDNDPTKQHMLAIVEEANKIGYRELSEEKRDAMIDCLQEQRDQKYTGAIRRPLVQMHDARITLDRVNTELANLHMRGGVQYFLIACRSQTNQMSAPVVFFSNGGLEFMTQIVQVQPGELVSRFDAFCVNSAGIQGVLRYDQVTQNIDKKNAMKNLTLRHLKAQLFKLTGSRSLCLEWTRWDDKMTRAHGIVMVGWPLAEFIPPSKIKTTLDHQRLLDAVTVGYCHLRKLSEPELVKWLANPTPTPTGVPPPKDAASATITTIEDEDGEYEEDKDEEPPLSDEEPAEEPSPEKEPEAQPSPASSTAVIPFKRGGFVLNFGEGPAAGPGGQKRGREGVDDNRPHAKRSNVLPRASTASPVSTTVPGPLFPTSTAASASGTTPTPAAAAGTAPPTASFAGPAVTPPGPLAPSAGVDTMPPGGRTTPVTPAGTHAMPSRPVTPPGDASATPPGAAATTFTLTGVNTAITAQSFADDPLLNGIMRLDDEELIRMLNDLPGPAPDDIHTMLNLSSSGASQETGFSFMGLGNQ